MPAHRFSLVKWYLDCVAESGDAAIFYCATLCWRGLHAAMGSVLTVQGGEIAARSSVSSYRLRCEGRDVHAEHPDLKVAGSWRADAAPAEIAVYRAKAGSVVWNCVQPRSQVDLRVGDRRITGLGYAERLTLTLPPWRLPLSALRWGRFVSRDDSLAWIDWQGEYATRFAILNGRECEMISISEAEVALRGAVLRMEESVTLRSGRLGDTLLPGAPALGRLFPRSVFGITERKWKSRGTLDVDGRSSIGNVIHEVVHWES